MELLKNPRWRVALVAVAAVVLVPLLTWLRVPCTARAGMVGRAVLLGSVLLLVSLPAVWFLCRALLGRVLGTAGFATYLLLTLFPYRFLYPRSGSACRFVAAPPHTVLGLPGSAVLWLFAAVGLGLAAFIHRHHLGRYVRTLPRARAVIYALILGLCVTQVAVRYGSRSPKSVAGGWHQKETPYHRATFWHVRYGGGDHPLHVIPAGMFRGVGAPKDYNHPPLKINRRSVGPFLYAQLTPHLNPYAAAIAVNFLFFLIIVLGGYRLARAYGLSEWPSAGFAALLSANHFVLWRTVVPYFYIPFDAAFVALLLGLTLLRPLQRRASAAGLLQFGSLLALAAIAYDSSLLVIAVGLLTVVRIRRLEGGVDWRLGGVGLGLAALPVLVQRGWEGLLLGLNVAGNPVDAEQRGLFLGKLAGLPAHVVDEPWETLRLLDHSVSRLGLVNRLDIHVVEYWAVLGLVGVVALFALVPRYLPRVDWRDLLLVALSSVILGVLIQLAATIPPRTKIDQFALDPMRTSSAVYVAVVLGQTLLLYHLAERAGGRWGRGWGHGLFAGAVGSIWVLSFGRLWWS